jgi:hypothetical protein
MESPMDNTNVVLTLGEVAAFLRTEPVHVRQLLEGGNLAGFKVAGEWRMLWVAIVEFLQREMAATQQEALSRNLNDPRTWARELQQTPELVSLLEGQAFEDGTMGAYLKKALQVQEQESTADNVLPFKAKRD